MASEYRWRAGLPALGREAALEPLVAVYQVERGV